MRGKQFLNRFRKFDLEFARQMFCQARMLRIQILRGLGRISEAKIEAEEAIKIVERHLEWHPDDSIVLYNAACNYTTLNKARYEALLKKVEV